MINVIIFGTGDFAKQLYSYLSESKKYYVVCFTVDRKYIGEKKILGKDVIPFEDIETKFEPKKYMFITAVGYKSMRNRNVIYNKIKEKGYSFINYIHNSVIINKPFIIGDNNIILSNVIIEPNTSIGCNNIIYSNTVIGHDNSIGNHNFISIGNKIAGFVSINNLSFIGIGCTIADHVRVESESLLGAGSLFLSDTERLCKYYGVPAKLKGKFNINKGIEI